MIRHKLRHAGVLRQHQRNSARPVHAAFDRAGLRQGQRSPVEPLLPGRKSEEGRLRILRDHAGSRSLNRSLARYTVNDIPPNPPVQADVDDVNNNVGFWADQEDFRFPERMNPGLANFSDLELEAIGEDQNATFVDYQTRLALRAIERFPDADLVMVYIEEPDGFEHQYLLTDPRQATNPLDPNSIGPNQDPAKVARYAGHIESAYRTANEAVARIMDAVSDGNGRSGEQRHRGVGPRIRSLPSLRSAQPTFWPPPEFLPPKCAQPHPGQPLISTSTSSAANPTEP